MSNFRFDELMQDLGVSGTPGKNAPEPSEDEPSNRRPDMAGSGLGSELPSSPNSEPSAIRPGDALSELWTPEEHRESAGDLATMALDRGFATSEQIESARRMEDQSAGRSLRALLVDAGADEVGVQSITAELSGTRL